MNTTLSPALRHPKLHARIDAVRDEDYEKVEQFLIELEFDRLFNKVSASFGQAAIEGRLDHADEVIAEVRSEKRKRSA